MKNNTSVSLSDIITEHAKKSREFRNTFKGNDLLAGFYDPDVRPFEWKRRKYTVVSVEGLTKCANCNGWNQESLFGEKPVSNFIGDFCSERCFNSYSDREGSL